jgi:hypothetical protein
MLTNDAGELCLRYTMHSGPSLVQVAGIAAHHLGRTGEHLDIYEIDCDQCVAGRRMRAKFIPPEDVVRLLPPEMQAEVARRAKQMEQEN